MSEFEMVDLEKFLKTKLEKVKHLDFNDQYTEAIQLNELILRTAERNSLDSIIKLCKEADVRLRNHERLKIKEDFRCKVQQRVGTIESCEEIQPFKENVYIVEEMDLNDTLSRFDSVISKSRDLVPKIEKVKSNMQTKALRSNLSRQLQYARILAKRKNYERALLVLNNVSDIAESKNYADIAEESWNLTIEFTIYRDNGD